LGKGIKKGTVWGRRHSSCEIREKGKALGKPWGRNGPDTIGKGCQVENKKKKKKSIKRRGKQKNQKKLKRKKGYRPQNHSP